MAEWVDRMLGRVRDARTIDEARTVVKDYIDPATGERVDGNGEDDGDQHIHIHLENNGEDDMRSRDEIDPGSTNPDEEMGTPDNAELAQMVSALTQRVEQLEDMVGGDESEIELEDPETRDARRFTMRRGSRLQSTRDEEDPETLPERNPEIMGETDLPGIEDLDKRMPTASAGDRAKARDSALRRIRTADSADMEDNWRDTVALAEIIVPGIRTPTFDARLPALRSAERLCALRRRVVDHALQDRDVGDGAKLLTGLRTTDGVACDTIKVAFHSLAAAMRQQNNAGIVMPGLSETARTTDKNAGQSKTPSLAELNQRNREFWQKQGNGASRH